MSTIKDPRRKHIGYKIGRMRELLGIKQDAIAAELGISQQQVSRIEQSEKVDNDTLHKIADILGVSAEAIENFNEEATMQFIQNNYEGSSTTNHNAQVHKQNNYRDDALTTAINENKRLYQALLKEKNALLKEKEEKIALLQRLLDSKK